MRSRWKYRRETNNRKTTSEKSPRTPVINTPQQMLNSSQSFLEDTSIVDPLTQTTTDNDANQQLENHSPISEQNNTINNNNTSSRFNFNMLLIISYGKELLCIVAFILTTFASFQNSAPKVSRAVMPTPFFSKGSLIEDYFFGQLSQTQTKVSLSELSFVLYYAPWSSESQHSRHSYEHVARLFHKEAYFSAINCWQPGSECRNQYAKIQTWPILMAYQRNGLGVQYQKNLWTESALTKFVTSMLSPIHRLDSPDDLLSLMTSKDAAIVAFIDMDIHQRHYKSFYQAAVKYIERDPFQEVGFGVVTGETALHFGIEQVPYLGIRAYLWNETLEYNGNSTWNSREIIRWINEHFQQVSMYLSPPGIKTSSLAPYLKKGPLFILFTPRNFYNELSDQYVMLQQIGMEYNNCNDDNWIQEMSRDYLFQRRKENLIERQALQHECRKMFKMFNRPEMMTKTCDVTVSFVNVLNSSKNCDGKFKNIPNYCEVDELKKTTKDKTCGCQVDTSGTKNKYSYEANIREQQFPTSMLTHDGDNRSPESIQQYHFRRKCEMMQLSERKSENVFIEDVDPIPLKLVSGLACKSNRTLTLLSIDSLNFHTFAERLGIDILEMENKTAAIIMDHENESTFLLNEPVNLASIARFIYMYHRNRLTRFLRTYSVEYKHTHFFNINEFLITKQKERQEHREIYSRKYCEMDTGKRKDSYVVIREINSEDFDDAVINNNRVSK